MPGIFCIFPSMEVQMFFDMVKYFYLNSLRRKLERKKEIIQYVSQLIGKPVEEEDVTNILENMKKNQTKHNKDKISTEEWMTVQEKIYGMDLQYVQNHLVINKDMSRKVLNTVSEIQRCFNENKAVVLASCSMMEVLFSEFIISVLFYIQCKSNNEIESEMKKKRFFQERIKYVKKLIGLELSEAIESSCKKKDTFYEDWMSLVKTRNDFAHGNPFSIEQENAEKAYELCKTAVDIFAALQNEYIAKKRAESLPV